ncbi:hypothetical protein [Kerstersia gyiorum]|jgi:hypothetical protein|uniref:hypothetical protein n=2 Tax=Kerstersia gyiorum TaxID=206506 RepID=UPI00242F64FB|nr:hypothetical protein [Kerstersia gyiorum]MCI1227822.1 hypothetical protein [Kerstersia gyiorum]
MSYLTRLAATSVAALALHGCGGGGEGETANPIEPGQEEPAAPVSVGACQAVAGDCVEQLGVGDISKLGDWKLESYIDPPKIVMCEEDCIPAELSTRSFVYLDGYYAMPYPALKAAGASFFYETRESALKLDELGRAFVADYGAILVGYPRVQRKRNESEGVNEIHLNLPFIILSQDVRQISRSPSVYRDGWAIDEAVLFKTDTSENLRGGYSLSGRYFTQGDWSANYYGSNGSSFDLGDSVYTGFMIYDSDVLMKINETYPLMCQNRFSIAKKGSKVPNVRTESMQCLVQWKEDDWFVINVPTDTTINNPSLAEGLAFLNEYIENAAQDPNTDHYISLVTKKYTDIQEKWAADEAADVSNLSSLATYTKNAVWSYTGRSNSMTFGSARHWMQSVTNELNKRYDPTLSLEQGRLVPRAH